MADPEPDDANYYFIGYADGAFSFQQAIELATRQARARIGGFLGTEVIEKVMTDWEQARSLWGGKAVKKDAVRAQLTTIVNESIRSARVTDQYIEKVEVTGTLLRPGRVRYDAGVLVQYPKAEYERLLKFLPTPADPAQVAGLVRKAEALWAAGDRETALDQMRKAHREFPMDQEIAYRLATYLEDTGHKDEAADIYRDLALRGGDTEWVKLAVAKAQRESAKRQERWLELLVQRKDFKAQDLATVLGWVREGQFSRARMMARDQYNRKPDTAFLYSWHMASSLDYQQTKALAAQYDLQKSKGLVQEAARSWKDPRQAEPAIFTLLGYAQEDAAAGTALEALQDIKSALPRDAAFSPEVGNMATLALGERKDQPSQNVLEWLNRSAQTQGPAEPATPPATPVSVPEVPASPAGTQVPDQGQTPAPKVPAPPPPPPNQQTQE